MKYPLVRELAADGIPVTVTCRVLKFSTQGYYKWLRRPCSDRDYDNAVLTNAALKAHLEDPGFGYRFLLDELQSQGHKVSARRVWRLCSEQRIWASFVKKSRSGKKPGPPVHDDLVKREFSAEAIDQIWFTDITEHRTAWIPAVVATPGEGGGNGRSEIQPRAERSLLRVDRQGRNGESCCSSLRRQSGCRLQLAPPGGSLDAAVDPSDLLGRGEGGVLPPLG